MLFNENGNFYYPNSLFYPYFVVVVFLLDPVNFDIYKIKHLASLPQSRITRATGFRFHRLPDNMFNSISYSISFLLCTELVNGLLNNTRSDFPKGKLNWR